MLRLDKIVLRGTRTRLEPLTERHLPGLAAVIADGDLWQLPVTTMQLNRVELLTDQLNAASRTAIVRLGAQQEGVLRSHMVMRSGRLRDSVIFSLIATEWPPLKARLVQAVNR